MTTINFYDLINNGIYWINIEKVSKKHNKINFKKHNLKLLKKFTKSYYDVFDRRIRNSTIVVFLIVIMIVLFWYLFWGNKVEFSYMKNSLFDTVNVWEFLLEKSCKLEE